MSRSDSKQSPTTAAVEQDRRRPPAARVSVKVAVILAATCVGLLFSEIVIRTFQLAPQIKPIVIDKNISVHKRSSNPILGYELKANYNNPQANLVTNFPSTNSHGLRDIERSVHKPSGTSRIIVLGDSVVVGYGVRDIGDTIAGQAEKLFANEQTEVLNFGTSGYCTRAEVELLEVKGLQFDPDIVALVFVVNDFTNFNTEAFTAGDSLSRPESVKQLFAHSHLFRLSCIKMNLFQFRDEAKSQEWNARSILKNGENNVVVGLKRFRQLAAQHAFKPVILIWPRFTRNAILAMPGGAQNPIEQLAEIYGIQIFRLAPYFEKDRASFDHPVNPRMRYTIGDGMHPSRQGARVVAFALKDIVAQLKDPPADVDDKEQFTADEQQVIAETRSLGKREPSAADSYNFTGHVLLAQGKIDAAITLFRAAIRLKPDYPEAHANLGHALIRRGDLDEALRYYRRAIMLDSNFIQFSLQAADALAVDRNHLADAVAIYRLVLEFRPHDENARRKLQNSLDALEKLGKTTDPQS